MNINGNKHFAEQYEGVKLNRWLCICYLRSKLTEYYANARASAASKHRTGVASYAVFSFANKNADCRDPLPCNSLTLLSGTKAKGLALTGEIFF